MGTVKLLMQVWQDQMLLSLLKLIHCLMEVFLLSKQKGYYDLVSNFFAPTPKSVEGLNNSSYMYYRSQLYLKLFSVFKFNNFPLSWNLEYFKNVLFPMGFISVVSTESGVLPLLCGYTGINVYNFPTEIHIANPVIGTFIRKIGVDGELVYFNYINDCFLSLEPLITRYAVLLASCDGTLNTSLMNSRIAHIFTATTDAELETYKRIYDEVSQGKPAVFLKKPMENSNLFETNNEFINVKNTYIGNDILLTKRTIINEFLTEIGINNFNSSKRERLITDEVNANNGETLCLVELWKDTLNSCFKRVNALFGINVSVELNTRIVSGEGVANIEPN